ncbi:hypothetical protein EC973_006495 [Apophysomyces ossiformis]|uniref:AB hydrolase-1 domain-containing protein n=1 Tax=Apophysomyces ossiformis TaxID=679940 RepID=A0A8H7BT95_9FUNG|nr:hypothetical protein EC973_006495 [Apophysomyces ossiformis]
MIPDSYLARQIIYTAAVLQTAIAPLAFVYYVYYIATEIPLFTLHPTIDHYLHYWLGTELIFYVFFQITRNRMQRTPARIAPEPKERRDLFMNCVANVDDIHSWLPGWFMKGNNPSQPPDFEEICRENAAEWQVSFCPFSWAFFTLPLEDVLDDPEKKETLDYYITTLEKIYNIQFKPGYNDDLVSFRVNLDPVVAYHRPLAFYTMITIMTYLYNLCLQVWGMRKYGPEARSFMPWNVMEPIQPLYEGSQRISYWFRDGNRNKKPVVFVHGVGAGLMCYAKFVFSLLSLDAPIFCVELPFVAMRCVEDVPTMPEIARDFELMLQYHHFHDAVFVAHSLGTAVTAFALKSIPKSIAGVVLLDPICFMLHYKDICTNFVYRIPRTASQYIVKYFGSTELYISHFISRHFYWFQVALYVTPVSSHKHIGPVTTPLPRATKVFLSEHDNIVDSYRADAYLKRCGINSVLMEGLDHASFLFHPEWERKIIDTINEYTMITDPQ